MTAIALPILQRTPEWLDARLEGIGSSEAAAALNMSRWESPSRLWAIKLRLIPGREPTLPMLVGTETEPLNARLYEAATGQRVRRVRRLLRHDRYPWMLASLDRRVGRKIVELKWTERATDYGEPGTDEVPDEVLLQVMHQLVVTDLPEADVSVLIGGRDHRIYHVARDPIAAEELIEREHTFWRAVEERREPQIDGSDASHVYLRARYPLESGELLLADEAVRAVMAELRGIRRNERQVAVARKGAEALIKAAIGNASGIEAPGIGSVRWARWDAVETSVEFTDWQAVAAAYRALVLEFTVVPREEVAEKLDALAGIHTNTVSAVTKKAGDRFGPPQWESEDEDAVA